MTEFAKPTRTWFESNAGEAEQVTPSATLQAWLDGETRREYESAQSHYARRWRRRAVATIGVLLFGAAVALAWYVGRDDSARDQMRRWLTMDAAE